MPSMHSGHRQRVKERFLAEGIDAFEPHQVLEMALFFSVPFKDTNELAHRLIDRFGSLHQVMEADVDQLTQVDGVGVNTAMLLKFIPAAYKAYSLDKWQGRKIKLNSTKLAVDYLFDLFVDAVEERFYVLCLDSKNCLAKTLLLDSGTISETGVNARALVERILRTNATGVILAHSHPSGNPDPSFQDIESTNRVYAVLKPLGIRVYDHIIISGDEASSFSGRGLLPAE